MIHLEDLILKGIELGALGIFSLFLLTKGTSAINDLADSNRSLADSVAKLSDKINQLDTRVNGVEFELRNLDSRNVSVLNSRLDKLESALAKSINKR